MQSMPQPNTAFCRQEIPSGIQRHPRQIRAGVSINQKLTGGRSLLRAANIPPQTSSAVMYRQSCINSATSFRASEGVFASGGHGR